MKSFFVFSMNIKVMDYFLGLFSGDKNLNYRFDDFLVLYIVDLNLQDISSIDHALSKPTLGFTQPPIQRGSFPGGKEAGA